MLKRRIAMSTVLLMALCFTGCTDKQLSKANKLVLDYAATIKVAEKAVAVGESTTIILNGKETKIIPMNSASSLMTLLNRANTAGQQVKDILAGISKLDDTNRNKITSLLTTISTELDPTKIEEIVGIKNADTKLAVETAFTGIRTIITSITISIAIGG